MLDSWRNVLVIQIVALIIFIAMFIMIVMEKVPRHIVTLVAGLAMIVIVFGLLMRSSSAFMETLAIKNFVTPSFWYSSGAHESTGGVNWATIVFIAGMMVMVEGMGHAGFFKWLCLTVAKAVNYNPVKILMTFMAVSTVLAMFIDSITVILFLASVTIELAKLLKFNPIPMILAEIFCANLGGSATMCGDPPNIIIGTHFNYSFTDFLTHTGPMALVGFVLVAIYFYVFLRKKVKSSIEDPKSIHYPEPKEAITSKYEFIASWVIFLIAVVLLVTHAMTGLTVSTIGVGVAALTLILFAKHIKTILKKVDYKTLLFLLGMFIVVGGLEQTGVLEIIAEFIAKVSGGHLALTVIIILWVSAIASAFIDNIPFAATMVPVIENLAVLQGVPVATFAWTLAMGTDIGGSMTPIGASANVVGVSVSQEQGYKIGWGQYCKISVPPTIIVLAVVTVMLLARFVWAA